MVRELTQTDADALIARHISPHPANRGRAEYWLEAPGISVWAIIGSLEASPDDTDGVAEMYGISREEVEAAIAYYHRHRELIDDRLDKNQF